MSERFYIPAPPTGASVVVSEAEAHHLLHVMRARVGDEVVLFDGQGCEYAARVARLGRSEVELSVLSRREINRELPGEISLGVALPKGDRQAWLVEKATELGVTSVTPLLTARAVAMPVHKALDRLRRTAIEAAEQCGRNRLPRIEPPQTWGQFVGGQRAAMLRLLAHPGGEPVAKVLRAALLSGPVSLAVGPEGGLTDEEVAAAVAADWRSVDLGPRILRVETAALALIALVANAPGS